MDDRVRQIAVLLQLANFVTTATCSADVAGGSPVKLLSHNVVEGLKPNRLPTMTKVHISNEEFHSKYLEYFRRLHEADAAKDQSVDEESTEESYENDVSAYENDGYIYEKDLSAIQIRGQVMKPSLKNSIDSHGSGVPISETVVTFPIERAMLRQVSIIKSVARIFGWRSAAARGPAKVTVAGSLWIGETMMSKPSHIVELTWPAGSDNERWQDIDVTLALCPRNRLNRHIDRAGEAITLRLTLVHGAAAEAIQYGGGEASDATANADGSSGGGESFGDDEDYGAGGGNWNRYDDRTVRHPVLHCFLDGTLERHRDVMLGATHAGDAIRDKPDDGVKSKRHRRGRRRRRRRRSVLSSDCANLTTTGKSGKNGSKRNKCCRESMIVVVADIPELSHIIEPKWFDAGLCRGRCPIKYNVASQHAYLQNLLRQHHHNNNNNNNYGDLGLLNVRHQGGSGGRENKPPPTPCCAPKTLEGLQILTIDKNNPGSLLVTTWNDTTVVNCRCS